LRRYGASEKGRERNRRRREIPADCLIEYALADAEAVACYVCDRPFGPRLAAVSEKDLARNLEQSRPGDYRRRVLDRLHKARTVEWNTTTGMVTLSPLGRDDVEGRLLK